MFVQKLRSLLGTKKRVLLLQGPMGPFFSQISTFLKDLDDTIEVTKVNFNGGDLLFYPFDAFTFREDMDKWPQFLKNILIEKKIEQVILFGDCRPIHRVAHEQALKLGIDVAVFEEGYIRPDYITLEKYGVNGYSKVPHEKVFFEKWDDSKTVEKISLGNTFYPSVFWVVLYYLAAMLLFPFFRHYKHHRPLNIREGVYWFNGLYRRFLYKFKERGIQERLTDTLHKQFFLLPLQVHNDAQIRFHSEWASIDGFIQEVVQSFVENADKEHFLVIKHHPMDRAYKDYTQLIRELSIHFGVEDRIFYIHDQHLPSILSSARGVVTLNSTVGLSALFHGAPVKAIGNAIYNIDGLTYQNSMNQFWSATADLKVDKRLYDKFVHYLITQTQVNDNFYRRNPANKIPFQIESYVRPREYQLSEVDAKAMPNFIKTKI